ncbi:hypothetical protein [Francisella frigiditurris]|uniref:Lipoprotein n=1 Tax=Francisella frigiditurris TaxID=1542390 RepID=A0A1J0KU36_9GAMM|nr:hypothetical protein [Francisella frigiditurris]APC97265.1 hypothetical protein KX01_1780 [Francisella frigiditurris]
MKKLFLKLFLYIYFFSFITGCATLSSSHPDKIKPAKDSIRSGVPKKEEQNLRKVFLSESVDSPIGFLEVGRFEQFAGSVDTSQKNYNKATDYVAKTQTQALIRVRDIISGIQSVALSDKERLYRIQDYEITFLYIYRALNFLINKNIEDAAVSIRNLSYAQYATFESKQLAQDIKRTTKQDIRGGESQYITRDFVNTKQFRDTQEIASKVVNSYENGFGYYLEALIYQAYDNDLNNVHLSMKNASRILPNNPYVSKDYEQVRKAFYGEAPLYKDNQGKLVLIYEQGLVESIKRFDLPIIIFARMAGVQKISLPYYDKYVLEPSVGVKVFKDNNLVDSDKTSLLVDTTAMAAKSLSDDYPAILSREIARVIAKVTASVAAIQSSGDYGALAAVAATAYSQLTTVADQRSWLLLPNNVQLYSINLDQGYYNIEIDGKIRKVKVQHGKNSLLWITKVDKYDQVMFNSVL